MLKDTIILNYGYKVIKQREIGKRKANYINRATKYFMVYKVKIDRVALEDETK